MSAQCPVTGRACATAYGRHRCRCSTCRTWNAEHSRRGRKPGKREYRWTQERVIANRHKQLHAEFDAAVRTDPSYAIAIARAFHKL